MTDTDRTPIPHRPPYVFPLLAVETCGRDGIFVAHFARNSHRTLCGRPTHGSGDTQPFAGNLNILCKTCASRSITR